MEKDIPNLGYVFRGTLLRELYDPVIPGFVPNSEKGIICYTGNKKFTPELHAAIFYSYNNRKKAALKELPNPNSSPCVICVDAKYSSNYPETGSLNIMLTPASEIRIFTVDTEEGVKRLISEAKKNPTKELTKIVDDYSGWENFEKIISEGIQKIK